MKIMYCWRCQMDIPMLEDHEIQLIRKKQGQFDSKQKDLIKQQKNLLRLYNKITGFNETNSNAVYHHVASLYGPPCESCGKPLRTPKANWCAYCGSDRKT